MTNLLISLLIICYVSGECAKIQTRFSKTPVRENRYEPNRDVRIEETFSNR